MLQVLLDNKNGNVWDLTPIVSGLVWKTSRIGTAGSCEITFIKNGLYQDTSITYNNGDIVAVKKGNFNVFYGYIFGIDGGRDDAVKLTCYDQTRYLMNQDTYVFSNMTASEVLRRIAADFNLKLGQVDDTGYRIPTMVEDGKKLMDIVCKALDLTLINAGVNYFLYDDFGALSLRRCDDFLLEFFIGETVNSKGEKVSSLLTDYTTRKSIDSDTFNRIKLYQDNESTGKREVYMAQDSANIAKWGVLQLYQSVDENMNSAQINELLSTLAAIKNRETKTLKIEAIGDIRVRAGAYVPIVIPEENINQPFLINECTHRFDGPDHTMTLELKVI